MRSRTRQSMLILACAAGAAPAQTVWRVDADALGQNDGSSWADAFTDLQGALGAAAPGDEVWVAEGVYTPSDTDATASFVMRSGVGLYGGFAGVEASRDQRDWRAHETILSGDIGRDDVVGSGSFWYGSWARNTANCGHVLVASGTDATAVLDGFTVADGATGPDGTPAGDPLMFGSGIYIIAGSPTIRNCRFEHNLAAFARGGAVYCEDGSPSLIDCEIVENYVHLGYGGGVFTTGGSNPRIEGCTFRYNQAVSGSTDCMGGAVCLYNTVPNEVVGCDFEGNVARPFYGVGTDIPYGGGLASFTSALTVRDCRFVGNKAALGAGLLVWKDATVINCLFYGNTAVPRPRDPYPEVGGFGAGALIYTFGGHTLDLINCTVAYNNGKKHVGLDAEGSGSMRITNSIVWKNEGSSAEVDGYWREELGGSFDAAHSCIRYIFGPPEPGEDPIDLENLPGCIDLDPALVSHADPHLTPGSPCIDSADNTALPPGVSDDFDGLPRFVDDPQTADTGIPGNGHAEVVDMGALELQVAPDCPGDFNGDGAVNTLDVLAFLNAWSAGDPSGDFNGDGAINTLDVLAFLNAWSAGC
ncbi:MAG: right-handed parallel beta-helix repeat-containing protein [Phycisphaerales bacterium]|nr:right-handed parallel beta-helix repeat-containing protein [Phycisphaerales bacterium]